MGHAGHFGHHDDGGAAAQRIDALFAAEQAIKTLRAAIRGAQAEGLPALQALSLRGLSLLTLLLLVGVSLLAVYRLGPASRRLPIASIR